MLFGAQEPSPCEVIVTTCCSWLGLGRNWQHGTRYQVLPNPGPKWILGRLVLSWGGGKDRTGVCGFVLATVPSAWSSPDISHLIDSWGREKRGVCASEGQGKEINSCKSNLEASDHI